MIKVVPDQIVITLGVETVSEDLGIAKSQNDARINKVLSIAEEMSVSQGDIQTSHLSIYPRYRNVYEQQSFAGFTVEKKIVVILKDLKKYRQFLSRILDAKVNYVHGIEFRHSGIEEYKKEARLHAIREAKEKAMALAGELGQEIGEPLSIEEVPSLTPYTQLRIAKMGGGHGEADPIALGKIDVSADVTVSFALMPSSRRMPSKAFDQKLPAAEPSRLH